jgi:cell division protein FtsA
LQLEVEAIVFNGLASSLAILTNELKEMGALVIDIGGGVTEYVVYSAGIIKHTGALAVGGDHLANDMAYGLKIPLGRAEELKIKHGAAMVEESDKGRTVETASQLGMPPKTVNLEHLRRIMSLRLEEMFRLIEQDLLKAGLMDYLRAGVLLTGGGSRIPGIQGLAQKIFDVPVTLGKTNSISGLKSALDQPEFATGIGLAKFGSYQQKKKARAGFLSQTLKETFGSFGGLLKHS